MDILDYECKSENKLIYRDSTDIVLKDLHFEDMT